VALTATILSGFLGAGKTSVIQHLLVTGSGPGLFIMINDFGSINIDEALIRDRRVTSFALTNGCVCCSIGDDLERGLHEATVHGAEHVLIEASGVADPRATSDRLQALTAINAPSIVTVVDCASVQERADDYCGDIVIAQICSADLVLLNKVDIVGASGNVSVANWIGEIAPHVVSVPCVHGRVPAELVLGLPSNQKRRHESHRSESHDHSVQFEEARIRLQGAITIDALRSLLAQLPTTVVRGKGFVLVKGRGWMLFQLVGRRWSLSPADAPMDVRGQLIFIGGPGSASETSRVAECSLLGSARPN